MLSSTVSSSVQGTVAVLTTVSWLQVRAYEESQRYKEGNYIIEKQRVMKVCSWISGIFSKACRVECRAAELPA